ncbi:MAG: nuclear transport factor 2 family protein [Novosphingobium sp.]|nr:nuclear transport factor 2 family protein [Novosphingobium sp.]
MNDTALKTYLQGWSQICISTPKSIAAMLEGAHPDMRFSDVNSPNVHVGHEGIRHLCDLASGKYSDAAIATRDLLFDGRNWSIRWTMTGKRQDGTTFSRPGVSAGSIAKDGRVIEHTDYWSRGDAAD